MGVPSLEKTNLNVFSNVESHAIAGTVRSAFNGMFRGY